MSCILKTCINGQIYRENGMILRAFPNGERGIYQYIGCEEKVVIPEGVTAIGRGAFAGHKNLVKVTFPKTLRRIGWTAFSCCGLQSVTLPEGMTCIPMSAFSYCRSLTSVHLPESLKVIEEHAFEHCSSLTKLEIPSHVSLNHMAFLGCMGLAGPDGLVIVGTWVCGYFGSGKTLVIPEGITDLDNGALMNGDFENVVFPASLKHIRYGAFSQCKALKHIRIPETVEEVNWEAFDSSTRVELPERICRLFEPYCPENWVGY